MTPAERLQAAIVTLEETRDLTAHWPALGTGSVPLMTLHRTIDAQLDILQHALARAEAKIAGGGIEHAVWSHTRDALALADAILGDTQ